MRVLRDINKIVEYSFFFFFLIHIFNILYIFIAVEIILFYFILFSDYSLRKKIYICYSLRHVSNDRCDIYVYK